MRNVRRIAVVALCFLMIFGSFSVFATSEAVPTLYSTTADELTIIHTNDIHARVVEGKYDGMGMARIKTFIDQAKAASDKVLVLDAGDAFHGTTFATLEKGKSVVNVFNEVGYDVMVPGNHDFNYGQDVLLELAEMANFDMVAANVKKGDADFLPPYVIKEVGGVKVGIFGLATPETTYKTHPDNVIGLDFQDPVTVAKAMVAELEGKTDVIVALVHLGNDTATKAEYKSETVAMNVPGIDVIIDGHSHTTYENGLVVGDTLIASTGEYDKNIGVVKIALVDGKAGTVTASLIDKATATESLMENETVINLIASIKTAQDVILSQVVANTSVLLEGERANVRTMETNLGNLITDAMVAETGAQGALTNGGGIRSSIDMGDITKGEIITVLPFGNYIVTKNLSGLEIKAALEHGTAAYPEAEGMFPHVSGITYTIDLNRPMGDRVVNIMIDGQYIANATEYLIATNDFLAAGGDGYELFTENEIVNEFKALDEAVIEYAASRGTVAPIVENRIMVIPMMETPADMDMYTVMEGDVLWKIAAMYGTTYQVLAEMNNIENPNLIFPGQMFKVPMQ